MPFDDAIIPFKKKIIVPLASGYFSQGLKQADQTAVDRFVNGFMGKYKVPGMSIAITKEGRLVYAKGFGVARKRSWSFTGRTPLRLLLNPAQDVNIWQLFRIASVSKPITAVAIMKLIEQGKLNLSDRVFGSGARLGTDLGFDTLSAAQHPELLSQITVQHLLEHTCGGWPNDEQDPMYIHPEMDHRQLITWVLENRPLDHVPGQVWAYSNFGFCLLGQIIERVSGQTYADYVRDNVLIPCGIRNMHIAGNSLSDSRSDEVMYYSQPYSIKFKVAGQVVEFAKTEDDPYTIPVARMDSHGGWLASAIDLVRFAVHVDGFATKPDILSSNSINTMTTPTTARIIGGKAPGYAKGWEVYIDSDENNKFHNGSLPGTISLLVISSNGLCWAAIANTWQRNSNMGSDLDQNMWQIINTVTQWPAHDLFPLYDDPWKALSYP
jgi:CubicO group peptidase (beta-lactamase class C family)